MGPLRITPAELSARLNRPASPCLLDARRTEAFRRQPKGIGGAVPVLLDETEPRIPDLPRDSPMVVYCTCAGQASSTRVATWLLGAGYLDVRVLEGGLPAWRRAGLPEAEITPEDQSGIAKWMPAPRQRAPGAGESLLAESAFLSGVQLPVRREMTVLFVDMVDSTRLLFTREPDDALRIVQAFMKVVVEIAVRHCGDVHDFEGDGAMLYFAGPGEAVPAAFNLREALDRRRRELPGLPQARFSMDVGPVMIGYIGGRERRSLTFLGLPVNSAARILKHAPPGGIAATSDLVESVRRSDPDLAARFRPLPERQSLKGFKEPVAIHIAPPPGLDP